MLFSNYLDKFGYFRSQGKGFSIFRSDRNLILQFQLEISDRIFHKYYIKTSDTTTYSIDGSDQINQIDLLIIDQDRNIEELSDNIETLINHYLYPAFFKKIPIVFFSRIDEMDYHPQIDSGLIHEDKAKIVNLL